MCSMDDENCADVWIERRTTARRRRRCMVCTMTIEPEHVRIYHYSRSYYERAYRNASDSKWLWARSQTVTAGHICLLCEAPRQSFATDHGVIPNPEMFVQNLWDCIGEDGIEPDPESPEERKAWREAKEVSAEWRDAVAGIIVRGRLAKRMEGASL